MQHQKLYESPSLLFRFFDQNYLWNKCEAPNVPVLDLIDQGVTTGQLHKLLCYPPVAATEKETQQAPNSNTILELPEGTAKGGRGATPEADRTELKSGKSRDGAQSGKGNIKPPNTGSEKSRAASSGSFWYYLLLFSS